MGDVFTTEKNKPDYKACAIHYRAKYKAKSKSGNTAAPTKAPHKINYGHVHPPILHLDTELRSSLYELWKVQWRDFFHKSQMFENEGLLFLKEQSVPDPNLKSLIALCDSVDSVFTLLDTQFSDKATELRVLKKHICGLPMLKENYDFEHQTTILKRILKYLTISNIIFSPGKDLDIP